MAIIEIASQRASSASASLVDLQALAYPGNVTSGDLLICGGACFDTTAAPTTMPVSDTLGTVYTSIVITRTANASKWLAYGFATASGACTVTVNPPSGTATDILSFGIAEFRGVKAFSVDGGNTSGTGTSASEIITTTGNGDLIIALFDHDNGDVTITSAGTQTEIAQHDVPTATTMPFSLAYRIEPTPGNYPMSWTTSGSVPWSVQDISFSAIPDPVPPKIGAPTWKKRRSQTADFDPIGLFNSEANFLGLFDKDLIIPVSAASGNTGTGAALNKPDTAQAQGQLVVTATASPSNKPDSVSATGTVTLSGTANPSNRQDSAQATASPIVTAIASALNKPDSVAALASLVSTVTGTAAALNKQDTVQAAGSATLQGVASAINKPDAVQGQGQLLVTATASPTNRPDSVSATGTASNAIIGTALAINSPDIAQAQGQLVVTGSASPSNRPDIAIALGNTVAIGNANAINLPDNAAASGFVGNASVTGIGISFNSPDTVSAQGTSGFPVQIAELGGGNYYYRQRHVPKRLEKRQEFIIPDNKTTLTSEKWRTRADKNAIKSRLRELEHERQRLDFATKALEDAAREANAAQLRLIAYLEGVEAEILEEESVIMHIMAELL